MFQQFFAKYEFRLSLDTGTSPRASVSGTCTVQALETYCRQQVKC